VTLTSELSVSALRYLFIPLVDREELARSGGPLIFARGEGCYLYDTEGRRYLDALSGVWVVNVGHGRREIAQAIQEQLEQLEYMLAEEGFANIPAIRLAERLASLTPGSLDRTFFTLGGSESVEFALKLARQYHLIASGRPRFKVISRRASYHGTTYFAMTVTGFDNFAQMFGPVVPGVKKVPQPSCFQCELDLHYPDCGVRCAESIEDLIAREGPDTVAAIIAEPVSTSAGVAIPPPEYWPRLREICDRYGILLIADEVVTGFGRTGRMFGVEHWNVVPDIMTVAKGLTSGYQPLGGVIVRREVAEVLDRTGLSHGFTYSAHPVACAAALANLDIIQREGLVDNAAQMGTYLLRVLEDALGDHPLVGGIRVIGLLAAIDLVRDRQTGERFPPHAQVGKRLRTWLLENGLYCRVGQQVQLGPPLCITRTEINHMVDVLRAGLDWLAKTVC